MSSLLDYEHYLKVELGRFPINEKGQVIQQVTVWQGDEPKKFRVALSTLNFNSLLIYIEKEGQYVPFVAPSAELYEGIQRSLMGVSLSTPSLEKVNDKQEWESANYEHDTFTPVVTDKGDKIGRFFMVKSGGRRLLYFAGVDGIPTLITAYAPDSEDEVTMAQLDILRTMSGFTQFSQKIAQYEITLQELKGVVGVPPTDGKDTGDKEPVREGE